MADEGGGRGVSDDQPYFGRSNMMFDAPGDNDEGLAAAIIALPLVRSEVGAEARAGGREISSKILRRGTGRRWLAWQRLCVMPPCHKTLLLC